MKQYRFFSILVGFGFLIIVIAIILGAIKLFAHVLASVLGLSAGVALVIAIIVVLVWISS